MKFKFGHRRYQDDAIQSVVDLFKGQPVTDSRFEVAKSKDILESNVNNLTITKEQVFLNLQIVQERNNRDEAPIETAINMPEMDFGIEMETGTGKTFVYFSTIAKLAKYYNWRKFIIIVPTIAIKEGVESEFKRLKSNLEDITENTINFSVYDSDKINELQEYYREQNCVEIILMTMGSFNKDTNILNRENPDSKLGEKPVDLLAKTKPIIILDEPQKMAGEATTSKLKNFNPMCVLRYSATHRAIADNNFKFIYRYTPLDAYRDKYVKKIEVLSVYDSQSNPAKAYVEVKEIRKGKILSTKLSFFQNTSNGIKERTKIVKDKDNLFELSNGMPEYKDYVITSISATSNEVRFRNGLIVKLNEVTQNKDEIMKIQIKETIRVHLEKEKVLNNKGIKVLTLFFLDKVINYRDPNDDDGKGKTRKWFEDSYAEITAEEDYKEFATNYIDDVQLAYFSVDKTGNFKDTRENSQSKADTSTYDLIMTQKEKLVSFDEPARFIFSHSALREGWDNPNVFQICNLNETTNEIRRRQEVGRGLRLPVDQNGERIMDDDINILTVASSVSYELFAKGLQEEITSDTGIKTSGRFTSDASKRKKAYLKKDNFENTEFKALWKAINKKLTYNITVSEDFLIRDIINKVQSSNFKIEPAMYQLQKTRIKDIYNATTRKEVIDTQQGDVIKVGKIPNVIKRIADFTGLTKKVIIKIILEANIQQYIFVQPDLFVEILTELINEELPRILIDGIVYKDTGEVYEQTLFNDFIMVYEDKDNNLIASDLDLNRTFYDIIQLDSETEVTLIHEMNADKNKFKFFVKLPNNFKVPTPAGNYNPDWALVFQDDQDKPEVYLVRESKKTAGRLFSKDKLRVSEIQKIEYGKKAFASVDVDYQVIQKIDDIKPKDGVFNFGEYETNFHNETSKQVFSREDIENKVKSLKAINPDVKYLAAVAVLGDLIKENLTEKEFYFIKSE